MSTILLHVMWTKDVCVVGWCGMGGRSSIAWEGVFLFTSDMDNGLVVVAALNEPFPPHDMKGKQTTDRRRQAGGAGDEVKELGACLQGGFGNEGPLDLIRF